MGAASQQVEEMRELHRRFSDFTMIWEPVFYENLHLARKFHQPSTSVVECGVWKGGMIAAMAAFIKDPTSGYHLFDSFEGLPPAGDIDGKAALDWQEGKQPEIFYDNCKASLEEAKAAMRLSGAERVSYYPGWFESTFSQYESDQPISILRLDADWYESTLLCLDTFYDRVMEGGVIIIDDYFTWAGCSRAVHDFLARKELPVKIRHTPREVAYIIKTGKT